MKKSIAKLSQLALLCAFSFAGSAQANLICTNDYEYQGVSERLEYWKTTEAKASLAKAVALEQGKAAIEASMQQINQAMQDAQQQMIDHASGSNSTVGGGDLIGKALQAYQTWQLGKEIDSSTALANAAKANRVRWEGILQQCEVDLRTSLEDLGYDEADFQDNCTDDYISVVMGRCDVQEHFLDMPQGQAEGSAGCTLIYDENNNVTACVGGTTFVD